MTTVSLFWILGVPTMLALMSVAGWIGYLAGREDGMRVGYKTALREHGLSQLNRVGRHD